jgi:hypothetical protein
MRGSFRGRSRIGGPVAGALSLVFACAIVAVVEQHAVRAQTNDVCDEHTGQSAEEIFHSAQDRWASNVYPNDLHYVLTISATPQSGQPLLVHYDGQAEPDRDVIWMHTRSREEAAQPPTTPHGINVVIAIEGRVVRDFTPKPVGFDILGIPRLSPVYDFGMTPSAAAPSSPPASEGLPTIATVAARTRKYRVSCVDTEPDDRGTTLDHLRLEPLQQPNRDRIREVWIESGSYWTDRMLLARNFVDGPPLHSSWDIRFDHDNNAEYITEERARSPLNYGRNRVYRDVTLTFERTNPPPSAATDFIFDHQAPSANELAEP